MKKTMMIAIVALFVMGLIATTSYAWKGAGPGSGGYGYNCPAYGSVDPEKAQNFTMTPLRSDRKCYNLEESLHSFLPNKILTGMQFLRKDRKWQNLRQSFRKKLMSTDLDMVMVLVEWVTADIDADKDAW